MSYEDYRFKNIEFERVTYKEGGVVIVEYQHYEYNKKLIFKNVKSARVQSNTFPYYESLLDKMGSDRDFYKMVNRAPKYNELYLMDINLRRVIIKFNGESWNEKWRY